MIIKPTPWEQRNLGVKTSTEFLIEPNDTWEAISGELEQHSEAYQVMNIPCGNTDVLLHAQEAGFRLIETNIKLSRKLAQFEMPRIYSRFEPFLHCKVASAEEIDATLEIIRTGDIFHTDKISRDPFFSSTLAGQRYSFWSRDIISNPDADLLLMQYKEKTIGFNIIVKESEQVADDFLGGLFPEYERMGMGFALIYLISKYAKDHGFKRIVTGVSSNNLPVLKLHETMGAVVEGMQYNLVKHNS